METPHTPPIGSVETPHIVINNNFTPNDALDPNNITGVGQVITDSGGGFIGTCTGTLINPRTVIFAAHCVNTRDATAYGAASGGVGAGIGFETNTRANAPGQVDELVRWLLGSTGVPPWRHQSEIPTITAPAVPTSSRMAAALIPAVNRLRGATLPCSGKSFSRSAGIVASFAGKTASAMVARV
ncbi:hypothetical protein, partial [Escherichia coli]|uniref:hypothetical protein n=1 Tax=Escherichia coli TaxID=562 RepID=UPI00190C67FB